MGIRQNGTVFDSTKYFWHSNYIFTEFDNRRIKTIGKKTQGLNPSNLRLIQLDITIFFVLVVIAIYEYFRDI